MKNPLVFFFHSIFLSVLLLNSACQQPKTQETKLEKINVAQFGDVFLYMPLYLADSRGFFKEEGIDISIINTGGDDKTFAAVLSGSATFGVADPTFVAIANEKGQNGKVIAGIVNGVPFWGITKNPKIPLITSPKLLGKYSVATFPSPSTAYALQEAMFASAGLKPNIKQAAFGTLIPMLEAGKADIALELEPNVSTAVSQGAKIVYALSDTYGDFAITGVTVTDETIKQKPQLVQHFINALTKAEEYGHKYPDSAAYYALKKFPDMKPEIIKSAMNRIIKNGTFPANAEISNNAWKKAIDLRIKSGDLKGTSNVMAALNMNFARNAIKSVKK